MESIENFVLSPSYRKLLEEKSQTEIMKLQTGLITKDEYLKKNEAINNEARFTTILVIYLIFAIVIFFIKIFLWFID